MMLLEDALILFNILYISLLTEYDYIKFFVFCGPMFFLVFFGIIIVHSPISFIIYIIFSVKIHYILQNWFYNTF